MIHISEVGNLLLSLSFFKGSSPTEKRRYMLLAFPPSTVTLPNYLQKQKDNERLMVVLTDKMLP